MVYHIQYFYSFYLIFVDLYGLPHTILVFIFICYLLIYMVYHIQYFYSFYLIFVDLYGLPHTILLFILFVIY